MQLRPNSQNTRFPLSNLECAGLEILVSPQGRSAPTRVYNSCSTEFEHKITTWTFLSLMPLTQQAERKGFNILAELTDSDQPGKVGVLLHNGDKKEKSETRWFSGAPVVFPCPIVKVNRKLQQSKPVRKLKTQTFRKEGLGQPTS